jgi:hypothetical protein
MFGLDKYKVQTLTVAVGSTMCGTGVDVCGCHHVLLEVPTFSVGLSDAQANVYVNAASTLNGTYRRVVLSESYSAAFGMADFEAPLSNGNKLIFITPGSYCKYLKFEVSTAATATYSPIVHLHW